MKPSQGFGGTGENAFISGEHGEKRSNLEGSRGTATILGNREHQKIFFGGMGNRGVC